MPKERADLGFGDELDGFDPLDWQKGRGPQSQLTPDETREIAASAGFKSREPREPPVVSGAGGKDVRRRRTGRNAQFNVKAKPETIQSFCEIADQNGWGLGETFEQAVALLQSAYGSQQNAHK